MLNALLDAWTRLTDVTPAPVMLGIGVVGLLLGGKWLVDGAVALSRRLGISTLVIGLTVVAFGTSAPELAFNIIAAVNGNSELSFGNVVGSNLANIGLVLGLVALMGPIVVHSRVMGKELPQVVAVSIVMMAMMMLGRDAGGVPGLGRIDGTIFLIAFIVVCVGWYRLSRTDTDDPLSAEMVEAGSSTPVTSVPLALLFFAGGLALLLLGGKFSETGAIGTARWLGISDTMIGLTVVAVATSLPEVATSVIAARRGHADLAVGNVVGSNLFNMLLVMGMTAVIAPVSMPPHRGVPDLAAMVAITTILWVLAARPSHTLRRRHGLLLLGLYLGYHVASSLMLE